MEVETEASQKWVCSSQTWLDTLSILLYYFFILFILLIPFTPIADGFIGSRGCVRSDLLSGHSFTQSVYHIIYHLITCTTLCF